MAETTRNEHGGPERADLASAALERGREHLGAALDRGKEQLEGAKGQLAEGAERVAAAVDRAADELQSGDGEDAISGFGHSVAGLMRQLAGGLRERDIDEFARELATLARRNPGVFLAGSVALGFGIARFFKARTPSASMSGGSDWDRGEWRDSSASSSWDSSGSSASWESGASRQEPREPFEAREEFDVEESLDFSSGAGAEGEGALPQDDSTAQQYATSGEERGSTKSRSKQRKSQRSATSMQGESAQTTPTDWTDGAPTTGGSQDGLTGGGKSTGGKS